MLEWLGPAQSPVDAVQQDQVLDEQAEFLATAGDLLAHTLEDTEQISATADEYLRLGLRQVPIAQRCEVSAMPRFATNAAIRPCSSCPRSSKLPGSTPGHSRSGAGQRR